MVLAGRENQLSDSAIGTAINTMVDAYLNKQAAFKGNSDELAFQLKSSTTSGAVQNTIASGAGDTRASLLSKYTKLSGSNRVFQTTSQLLAPDVATRAAIVAGRDSYIASIVPSKRYASSFYAVKDVRQKLGSGIGSLGKLRYYILVEGPTSSTSDDVILEMKQTIASSVAQIVGGACPLRAMDTAKGAASPGPRRPSKSTAMC